MESMPFHPAVTRWFGRAFGEPTPVQRLAWPAALSGRHTLIAAPTGSGKTLAAFLAAIDALVREGLERGLADETHVLYVSPLKALSNDIQKNLEQPLAGIRDALLETGQPDVPIRAWVRTGDTPAGERERMRRTPPHILVTTPESLFILLTSESGRAMLSTVRTVIVDEIHALAGNKRGAHLALSLERLAALCERPPLRIGLSATQKPIERMAEFLTGEAADACTIIDTGYVRRRDLALELPGSPLEAVMAAEVWQEIYDRLAELVRAHRTTLIFVNTRRLAERAARHLGERLGEDAVTAHHGSLAREHRLVAEQRLKGGRLRALVATASLELGIDIGDIDLVCQLGSPRSIATLLQRVGRSGHAVGGLPKGRLFPLSRDDLVECTALLDAVRHDELDRIHIPQAPLDVLAQHLVAEVAAREWDEAALYERVRHAQPYHALTRADYTAVVRMLADGYTTRRGRRGAYLHRDAVNGRLRARPGARLTAVTNAGAIPDQFDYDVILQPQGHFIGTLNEDFAFESLPGDIFQLGSTSYRVLKIEQGKLHAEDARGQPPTMPFWLGEAPGRTDELSFAVSRLRASLDERLAMGMETARQWLIVTLQLAPAAAQQLIDYLAAARAALGALPTQRQVILERFFDEAGDMHLVIHAPFGSRINRAWGLALRKRFCRKFNFELQAAATEDSIVLSLGPTHSFPLEEVAGYLRAHNVCDILIQALLDAPMFATRWRWVANTALAVPRNRNGKRVPAPFQRADAEDLVALVFPDQLACIENIAGDRAVPDHPLVAQTLYDCLHELMDIDGLERVLRSIEGGDIRILTRDLAAPSPLAAEILTASPYAFLDDAPAEERRTLAVQQRRFLDPADAADLGRLDPAAIARVRAEAWPEAATPDELHDGLVLLGFLREEEAQGHWPALFDHLLRERRATRVIAADGAVRWVAAERLAEMLALHPAATLEPAIAPVLDQGQEPPTPDQARLALLRSRLEGSGPITAEALSRHLGLTITDIRAALAELEQQGFVLQGRFSPDAAETEWCERRLLARIHRYTLKQLRSEIEAVAPADFMRFLFHWQRLDDLGEGTEALAAVLTQLEGYAAPAAAWEAHLLPARIKGYLPDDLDRLCNSGRFAWFRPLVTRQIPKEGKPGGSVLRSTPITLVRRSGLPVWRSMQSPADAPEIELSAYARALAEVFAHHPAAFFDELQEQGGLLHTQAESALAELVAAGLVNTDSYAGLRALLTPQHRRPGYQGGRRRRAHAGVEHAGRWVWLRPSGPRAAPADAVEQVAQALLRRYGVVFRRLLLRETGLPPWRDLIYVYRRLEARGEIRGGRFVEGFSGEQYALPEAVTTLREIRRRPAEGKLISLSGADPLNLTGIVTPGERVATQAGNRVLYRDGIPAAISLGGKVRYFEKIKEGAEQELRDLLLHTRHHAR
jgi:ATP-dependent Lhr-like helicase